MNRKDIYSKIKYTHRTQIMFTIVNRSNNFINSETSANSQIIELQTET